MTAPDRQADLAELITRYGHACADVETESECGTVTTMRAAATRRAELVEEFARRGFVVRSPT